jgi:hypothetical protein
MSTRRIGIIATVIICLQPTAGAQFAPDAAVIRDLFAARSLKCVFPWYASADWDADVPTVKSAAQDGFAFHIDGIDYAKSGARLIGNAGAEDLVAARGASSVSFIERVPVGALNVTTVYGWRSKDGHFKAVHSRHTAVGGPSPSQSYGFCQPW